MNKMRRLIFLVLLIVLCLASPRWCYANEISAMENELLSELPVQETEQSLKSITNNRISFMDLFRKILNREFGFNEIVCYFKKMIFVCLKNNSRLMCNLALLCVLSSFFESLSDSFSDKTASGIGSFVVALIFMSLVLQSVQSVIDTSKEVISNTLGFSKALISLFLAAACVTAGTQNALMYQGSTVAVLFVAQKVVQVFLFRFVEFYLAIVIINYILGGDVLKMFLEQLKAFASLLLKASLVFVISIHSIEGLLAPTAMIFRNSVLNKAISAIPGVGASAALFSQTIFGVATVVKNGIGVAGMFAIMFIALTPLIELAVIVLIYRMTSVLLGVMLNKQLASCVLEISDGLLLVVKAVLTIVVIMLIMIGMMTAFTGGIL